MRMHLWAFIVLIMIHWVAYMLVILKLAFLVGSGAAWFGRLIPTFWGYLLLSLFNCNRPIFDNGFYMSDINNINKDFGRSPCECCRYYCYSHVWSLALVP